MIGRFFLKMAAATSLVTPRGAGNVLAKAGGGVQVVGYEGCASHGVEQLMRSANGRK